jgi:hypothetical protein
MASMLHCTMTGACEADGGLVTVVHVLGARD